MHTMSNPSKPPGGNDQHNTCVQNPWSITSELWAFTVADFICSWPTFPTPHQCHAFGLWTDILPVHSSHGNKEWFNAFLGLRKLQESHISLNAICSKLAVASCLACRRGHPPIDLLDLPKKNENKLQHAEQTELLALYLPDQAKWCKEKEKRERERARESFWTSKICCVYIYIFWFIGSKPSSIPGSSASLPSMRVLVSPGPACLLLNIEICWQYSY